MLSWWLLKNSQVIDFIVHLKTVNTKGHTSKLHSGKLQSFVNATIITAKFGK